MTRQWTYLKGRVPEGVEPRQFARLVFNWKTRVNRKNSKVNGKYMRSTLLNESFTAD